MQLNVTGTPESLLWTGTGGSVWTLNNTSDWSLTASPATFYNLDAVLFDDTSANGTVTLTGVLQPQSVVVNNQSTAYTFSGPGSLTGSAALTKSGPGSLAITTANSYTRGTTISEGTLSISAATGLGSGFVAINNATLGLGAPALTLANELRPGANANIAITSGDNTLGGPLNGTGALAFLCPAGGSITLQGNIDGFTGSISLAAGAGTLRFNPPSSGQWGGADIAFHAGTGIITHRALTDTSIALGSLTGASTSQLRGGDQAGPGRDTYLIGALNTNTTFAGSITDGSHATPRSTAITKTGTGTLTLSGISTYRGDTTISAGTLVVSGSVTSQGNLNVTTGTGMRLDSGTVSMEQIVIDKGGALTGCGTLVADLINNGTVNSDCGVKLSLHGDVVNNGTFRITSGTVFELDGTFTNNGLLDLLTAQVSPAVLQNIENHGVIIDSSMVKIASVSLAGEFRVTIQSFAGHTYRLQRSATLANPDWIDLGTPQAGTGAILSFSDPAAPAGPLFYRIALLP